MPNVWYTSEPGAFVIARLPPVDKSNCLRTACVYGMETFFRFISSKETRILVESKEMKCWYGMIQMDAFLTVRLYCFSALNEIIKSISISPVRAHNLFLRQ